MSQIVSECSVFSPTGHAESSDFPSEHQAGIPAAAEYKVLRARTMIGHPSYMQLQFNRGFIHFTTYYYNILLQLLGGLKAIKRSLV